MSIVLYPLLAAVLFLAFSSMLNPLARRLRWVDVPGARKQHIGEIPLTGGLSLALTAATLSLLVPWPPAAWGLAIGCAAILAIGVYDDRFPLRARHRFFTQVLAALAIILVGDNIVQVVGETFIPHPVGLGIFAVPFTIVAIVGLVNAWNMSDGLDGLCGGYSVIAIFWFALAAVLMHADGADIAVLDSLAITLPLIGALLVFLFLNARSPWRKHASLFLGDGGSMFLGLVIAWLAVHLTQSFGMPGQPGAHGLAPVAAVWIVALPLADMFSAMIRRVRAGVTPMSPDRCHLHHLMLAHGYDVAGAAWRLKALAFGMGALGIGGWRLGIPDYLMFWTLVVAFGAYTVYMVRFWERNPVTAAAAPVPAARSSADTQPPIADPQPHAHGIGAGQASAMRSQGRTAAPQAPK